ncbi:RES family NAD+ phosphorylase [Nitratireductor aquibiodomus]|uniref:RES family NAD+ phosphorylase n=1 Tax=Nitratireductor aquibiodomus TaxID=204799 RepID=UPI0009DE0B1B
MTTALFRARSEKGLDDCTPKQFDFAEPRFVSEGRYNHAGQPTLYLADSEKTCFHELRRSSCVIGEIRLGGTLKVLDLVNPYEHHKDFCDILNALVFSALLSTPQEDEGYRKPAYVFSRFVADCARYSGFDAIRYPSTRANPSAQNLVVLSTDFAIGVGSQLIKLTRFDGSKSTPVSEQNDAFVE